MLAVCRRPQITVTTLVQLTAIQHQPLQRAPATDFCTFSFIILHHIDHCTLSQQVDDGRNTVTDNILRVI